MFTTNELLQFIRHKGIFPFQGLPDDVACGQIRCFITFITHSIPERRP